MGLNSVDGPARASLSKFYDDADADALVLNKWFSTQAGEFDLEGVKKLTEHPDFTWSNPNRMRSVVSVFAGANLVSFHAEDGSGYEYLAEKRGAMMKAQLEVIKDTEGVSKDVYEIAS